MMVLDGNSLIINSRLKYVINYRYLCHKYSQRHHVALQSLGLLLDTKRTEALFTTKVNKWTMYGLFDFMTLLFYYYT